MTDQKPQKLKKSETLEVRIPHETKQAFLTACREDGTTASEVVRGKIQTYLDDRERPTPQPERSNVVSLVNKLHPSVRRYGPRAAAGAVAAVALATFTALPVAAAPDFQAQFKRFDTNGDGVLSAEEFAGRFGGAVKDDTTVETRIIRRSSDGKDAPDIVIQKSDQPAQSGPAQMKQDAFSFWLPDELTGGAAGQKEQQAEYRFSTATELRIETDDKGASGKDAKPGAEPGQQFTFSVAGLRKQEFEAFDTDKDGKVSFAEYQARQKAMLTRGFEMLDANSDKFLSQDEYNRIGMPPMPKIDGGGTGNHRIEILSGAPKYSDEQLKAAFTKLDANKDNKLSLQEYLPPA